MLSGRSAPTSFGMTQSGGQGAGRGGIEVIGRIGHEGGDLLFEAQAHRALRLAGDHDTEQNPKTQ